MSPAANYALICVFILATICWGLIGAEKRYDEWSLIKARPQNESQLEYLNSLARNETEDIEIWLRGSLKRPFDIFVSPAAKDAILAKLRELEIAFVITATNIQRSLDTERSALSQDRASFFADINNSDWFTKYLTLDEMNNALKRLAKDYPDIVKISSIGKTHENRSITLVTVSAGDSESKPGIWLDGGIHAREWIAPATVIFLLNKLVTGYQSDAAIKNYVNNATFYIVPVLNPDGYHYSFEKDRMWRKNRRPKTCTGDFCCVGVDLNRNFDHNFGGPGTSCDSCSASYHGPTAFSEPETQAVRDFLTNRTNVQAFVNFHAYSQLWFYPYASPANTYPPDVDELVAVAKRGAEALESKYGTKFEVGTPPDILYEAAGGSFDWAKGVLGIKYSYALELRPDGSGGPGGAGFVLPPDQIALSGEETFAGLSVVFDAVLGKKFNNG